LSGGVLLWGAWRIYSGRPKVPDIQSLNGGIQTTVVPDDYRNVNGRNNADFKGDRLPLTFRPRPLTDIDGLEKTFVTEFQTQGVYKDGPIADRDITKMKPKESWVATMNAGNFLKSHTRSKFSRWSSGGFNYN